MRLVIAALALCLAFPSVAMAQSVVETNEAVADNPFDYPEMMIRAEGMREMSVMSANYDHVDDPSRPLRLIVRFSRGVDMDVATARLLATPASQLVSTISGADAASPGATISELRGVREVRRIRGHVGGVMIELPPTFDKREAIEAVKAMQDVDDVEAEGIVTVQIAKVEAAGGINEVPSGLLRTGLATQTGGRPLVQGTVTNQTSVTVAVIDTGVDRNHADINLVGGKDFTSDKDYGLDGNGHGTHVAGIIGARNNGAGVLGAVPGAPIWSLKVLSAAGQGTTTGVIDALNWVADNGRTNNVRVVNLSLTGPKSKMMCDAIRAVVAKGITVVAAAGNNGMEIGTGSPSDCIQALVVTAMADYDGKPGGLKQPPSGPGAPTTKDDTAASFSNYATMRMPRVVSAPGVHILSTVPKARCGALKCTRAGPYAHLSGTSMAAPLVSGMAALCYNSGECNQQRSTSMVTVYTAFSAANRSNRDSGFVGDPNNPIPRKFYGYLAMNSF